MLMLQKPRRKAVIYLKHMAFFILMSCIGVLAVMYILCMLVAFLPRSGPSHDIKLICDHSQATVVASLVLAVSHRFCAAPGGL